MAEDIYTTRNEGAPRETTVIHERSGGGAGWFIAVILVLALILGIWYFGSVHSSQVSRDNAVASAANSVGDAAKDVGNAAQDAADNAARR